MPAAGTGLSEIAWLFLRLGVTAFGGPAAHIAMMQDEVVRRRRWLSEQEFLDLLGATNLIPGPNSTELAIHIGHRRAGWLGLFIAGICFIVPSAMIVTTLAWLYVEYGSRPQAAGILYGVKPALIAVILQALYSLGKTALKSVRLILLALVATAAAILGVNELLILFAAGLLQIPIAQAHAAFSGLAMLQLGPTASTAFGLWPLFLFFAKVGSILFGSGYVLLAFLRGDLVERWHWLTEAQLLDAVAIGQVTPGPVFTTATFIGYVLGGLPGAVVATLGIFLPAFVFVAASGPLIPRLRRSPIAGAFLDGVNAASLALMAVVTWQLGRSAVIDVATLAIALLTAGGLFIFRLNSALIVAAAAGLGLLITGLR